MKPQRIMLISWCIFFACTVVHCSVPAYYSRSLSRGLYDISQACSSVSEQNVLNQSLCYKNLEKALPFDRSFLQSEKAKQKKKLLVQLFVWFFSQKLSFPEDGLILSQRSLVIPSKYYCILVPQRLPGVCGFSRQDAVLSIQERFIDYFLRSIRKIIYQEEFVDHNRKSLAAKTITVRGRGNIHIYPKFWELTSTYQLATLFHETQHLYPQSDHVLCGPNSVFQGYSICDASFFSGPWGANAVFAQLFTAYAKNAYSNFMQRSFLLETADAEQRNLIEIFLIQCEVLRNIVEQPSLPQDFLLLCQEQDLLLFLLKMKDFLQNHKNALQL